MELTEEELIGTYPRLWHMAHDGAWPAIRDHGLMSASALLDAYGVHGQRRHQLGSCRRPDSVRLEADGLPIAVLRDQKPMTDATLAKCLQDGLTPQDWYELLNSRSFFWLSKQRVWRLLKARAYRDVPQTVMTIDTASLVAAHRDRIWLSPINSGFSMMNAVPRGHDTFRRVDAFPFTSRAQTRAVADNVVELVVDHSVADLADHVIAVHSVRNDAVIGTVWQRPGAQPGDSP
ncbi:hypothetical protein KX816_05255 [Sphingosinicellaceae bacterium]|nr:hypothetical protein KX816_05255 [Sphingosinicellaceae bacterium]